MPHRTKRLQLHVKPGFQSSNVRLLLHVLELSPIRQDCNNWFAHYVWHTCGTVVVSSPINILYFIGKDYRDLYLLWKNTVGCRIPRLLWCDQRNEHSYDLTHNCNDDGTRMFLWTTKKLWTYHSFRTLSNFITLLLKVSFIVRSRCYWKVSIQKRCYPGCNKAS